MMRNIFTFSLCALLSCGLTRGDFFEECENIDSMYIEVPEDCSFFIFCHDDDSFRDACPDDSPYFSAIDQTCDIDRAVCENRPSDNTATTSMPSVPAASSTTTTTSAPSSPVTTNTLFVIPTAALTNPSTTISTIPTITATASLATTSQSVLSPIVVPMSCPAIDDPNKAVFLPNPKSCSDYFLCYHGEPLAMNCSNMLHFDIRQQKCDYPENVSCQLESVTPREQCLPHVFDVFPHTNNCNYYYLCSYGYLMVMQCPLNMGWDYEKRRCALLPQAKCYNSL